MSAEYANDWISFILSEARAEGSLSGREIHESPENEITPVMVEQISADLRS